MRSFRVWESLTQNRHAKKVFGNGITALFAATTILYCCLHLLVLISAWDANNAAVDLLGEVLSKARVKVNRGFPYLESSKKGGNLRFCPKGISSHVSPQDCPIQVSTTGPSSPTNSISALARRGDALTMLPVFEDESLISFMLLDASQPGEVVTLEPVCLQALQWPYQEVRQARRADTVVALYQVWLLMVSIAAIFCECIPHVMAALAMHVLALVWSSYQVYAITSFQTNYLRIISSSNGACSGVDLLPSYFQARVPYEITMTVVDFVFLLLSAYLSWRLLPLYGWVTFTKTSASPIVKRAYNLTQAIFSVASLTAFFYVASVSIWLDEITKNLMGAQPSHLPLFLGLYITSIILIFPWLVLGWFGIRLERKLIMGGFFGLSTLYLVGSGVMFKSNTFRQSFVFWPFLGAMFTTSFVLIVITVVLAVLSYLHFGLGLTQRLAVNDEGESGQKFSPVIDEKGELAALPLPLSAKAFFVTFPGEERLENPPQRSDSMSSSSTKSSRQRDLKQDRTSSPPIIAALPGAIKIAPPPQAAVRTALKPTSSIKAKAVSSWRYASEQVFWNKSKRHESAVSWGDMDASKLDVGTAQSFDLSKVELALQTPLVNPVAQRSKVGLPSHPAIRRQIIVPQATTRLDSVGSVFSEQASQQQRLYLISSE